MKLTRYPSLTWSLLLLLIIGFVLVGCARQPTTQPETGDSGYGSALTADYEDALDVSTQLALGTIKLDETEYAVTAEQASSLLPLWQSLQGSIIQGDDERNAVLRAIESKMTGAQLGTIRAMQLTQDDLGSLAPGGGMPPQGGTSPQGGAAPQGMAPQERGSSPGGQGRDASAIATRRAQVGSMSDEERQQMFSRLQQRGTAAGGGAFVGGGTLNLAIANVVRFLSERSGQAMVLSTNTAVSAPETLTAAPQVAATQTAVPTPTPTETAVPTPSPTGVAATPEPTSTPTAVTPAKAVPANTATPTPEIVALPTLVQIEDTDPGPPFTVLVSGNTTVQDPLVEASRIYRITGLVRNDSTETYDLSAIHVTFFDADGFRGSYRKFPQPGTAGEWIWHGRTEAEFGCLLLGPGASCPFVIEVAAQDMASFLIHPDAVVTTREPVPMELSDIQVTEDGAGFVRFTGTATNVGALNAKNVTVEGTLLDASGRIVSVGSTVVLQGDIAPGEAVRFDLRVEKEPYHNYQLYVQAGQDWD